jgi:membrane protease subunit HflK
MNEHPHPHDQPHDQPGPGAPVPPEGPNTPIDSGSQALSEALRSSFVIVKFVMVLLLLVFLGSGFFTVGPQERAIILRLGKPVGEGERALLGPGLHWSFPYPIDEYVKISITGIQRVTSSIGWYAVTPEQELSGTEPPMGGQMMPGDGYVLTSDGNIAHSRATLTYRINDPIRYVFNFVNASNAIQSALDNALLFAASRFTVDQVLTTDVISFTEAVRKRTAELVDQQQLGIIIEQFTVQSIPPRQLRDAFANVLRAEVNRNKVLTEARSHENQVLSQSSADAESVINASKSDRARLVAEIGARAGQFQKLLPQYQEHPQLFIQQRLNETLGRVFTNAQDKVFVSEGTDGKSRELRYLFNREPRLKQQEEQQPAR